MWGEGGGKCGLVRVRVGVELWSRWLVLHVDVGGGVWELVEEIICW